MRKLQQVPLFPSFLPLPPLNFFVSLFLLQCIIVLILFIVVLSFKIYNVYILYYHNNCCYFSFTPTLFFLILNHHLVDYTVICNYCGKGDIFLKSLYIYECLSAASKCGLLHGCVRSLSHIIFFFKFLLASSNIFPLGQKSAVFFCKGPDRKYFRLSLQATRSLLQLSISAITVLKQPQTCKQMRVTVFP